MSSGSTAKIVDSASESRDRVVDLLVHPRPPFGWPSGACYPASAARQPRAAVCPPPGRRRGAAGAAATVRRRAAQGPGRQPRGDRHPRVPRRRTSSGIRSVAVYTPDDRGSVHRVKADEAYEIGETGHPVRAYLDVDLIVDLRSASAPTRVYPGYGFLSENPRPGGAPARGRAHVRRARRRGAAQVGDKVRAREAARAAGLPVAAATEHPRRPRTSPRSWPRSSASRSS